MPKTDYAGSTGDAPDKREKISEETGSARAQIFHQMQIEKLGKIEMVFDLAENDEGRLCAINSRASRSLAAVELMLQSGIGEHTEGVLRLVQEQLENIEMLSCVVEPMLIVERMAA